MPGKTLSFRMGDVFKPDDDLSIWMCTIALAYNDLVTAHVRVEEATTEWERFYHWRIAIGHYSEIMLFLARMRERDAIKDFIASAPPELQEAYENALGQYDQNRKVAKHARNEAAFHYPDPKGVRAMRRALRDDELQDATGGVTSASGKVRDTRMHYADEVMATMLMNALGTTEAEFEAAYQALGDAVASFMAFANQAQDEFFLRHPAGTVDFRMEKS
jgi:hypothetical protein